MINLRCPECLMPPGDHWPRACTNHRRSVFVLMDDERARELLIARAKDSPPVGDAESPQPTGGVS